MAAHRPTAEFAQLYTGYQSRLYAFIFSLVGSAELAGEVLQETNLVLWEKSDEFTAGTNFKAWAFKVAYFQVMAMRERQGRDRLTFNDDLIASIAREAAGSSDDINDRQAALVQCLGQLSDSNQRMIRRRYAEGSTVKQIAQDLGRSANSVTVTLHRLRVALMRCIETALARGEAS